MYTFSTRLNMKSSNIYFLQLIFLVKIYEYLCKNTLNKYLN